MAKFEDSILFQFDNGKENRFQLVKDNLDKLLFFHLYHKDGNKRFIVDLKNGIIKYNSSSLPEIKEEKYNIRLIYFRRHTIKIGEVDLKEKAHQIIYHLGLQYNDKNGNNHQIILKIDSEGSWVFGE
jgi:hypothetical protein